MSDVETIKLQSRALRGSIAQSLDDGGSRFGEADAQLIKFHGLYQQEDRDLRQERKRAGLEPAYQFMLRTRLPGGALTAHQYLVEDELAQRFGNGTLRITTRQGLQLHGVLKGDLRVTIQEIVRALLSSIAACGDVNRNVMACPAPARTKAEEEAQYLARRLAEHFTPRTRAYHEIWIGGERVEEPELDDPIYGKTYLPRKFKMGVAAPGDNCIDVYTQDVAFVPVARGDELAGYVVLVGGGMGMTHGKSTTYPRTATPFAFVLAHEAIPVAQALVETQRDFGDRENRKHARFKYLVEERGIAWLREEVERRLGTALQSAIEFAFENVHDHLGWTPQRDGRWSLGVFVENGRVQDVGAARVRTGLRAAAALFKPEIRLTPQQNVMFVNVRADERDELDALLQAHGIETDPQKLGLRRYALACPALPTCGLALTDAERALPAVIAELQPYADAPLSIRMTGCPNGCARPYMGDVGLVGRSKDLYDVFLGGDWANTSLNWLYKSGVRRADLAAELRPLFIAWKRERLPDEPFGEFCSRVGRDHLMSTAQGVYCGTHL
jgi:sulfite reductase (ferredoxin)